MEIIKTDIDGVVIIEPRIFKDARGYFFESYSQREFDEKVGRVAFVQDNESRAGQREHVIVWRDAWPALPAAAVHASQAGEVRQRKSPRCRR